MDRDRIVRLLNDIREALKIVEMIVSLNQDEYAADVRNRYTLRLCIVEIVEAAVTIGLHILREQFGEEVEGYVQVFKKLTEHGVLSGDIGEGMIRLARLRNLIVYRYWEVDDRRLYREVKEKGLELIRRFVKEIERYASRT